MALVSQRIRVSRRGRAAREVSLIDSVRAKLPPGVLRWHVAEASGTRIFIECSVESESGAAAPVPPPTAFSGTARFVVANLIPTGVGCAFGGYAGDAGPITSLLASSADVLVTNPNAVNASNFVSLDANVLYAEGYSLDAFCTGEAALAVPRSNRIGLIVDACAAEERALVLNILNAVHAVHGINFVDPVVLPAPLSVRFEQHSSGVIGGRLDDADMLARAAECLLERGATAIAVTSNILEIPNEIQALHLQGRAPNPIGGAEALVSRFLTRRFGVPAAHAPLVNAAAGTSGPTLDVRASAEVASQSGLACVLIALRRAPAIAPRASPVFDIVHPAELSAVVAPASALGSPAVLSAVERRIPVIAVHENDTILNVTAERLGIPIDLHAATYLEAAGILLALRKGIDVRALRRPLAGVKLRDMPALSVAATGHRGPRRGR